MYFPIGWPKFYNAKSQTGKEDILKAIRFNRSRSLFATVSDTCIYLWKTKVSSYSGARGAVRVVSCAIFVRRESSRGVARH